MSSKINKLILIVLILSLIPIPVLAGNVILWDTMVKESYDFYGFEDSLSWPNRNNWQQVPYGTTTHTFVGEPVLENGIFWLFIHSDGNNAPFIYPNMSGVPGDTTELYVTYPGYFNGYLKGTQIIKNEADELIFKADETSSWAPSLLFNIQYRIRADSNWVEVTPPPGRTYSVTAHYGIGKFASILPIYDNNNDAVIDKDFTTVDTVIYQPEASRYAVWEIPGYTHYNMLLVIPADFPSSDLFTRVSYQPDYNNNWWDQIGTSVSDSIANNRTYFAIINQNNIYKHESPNIAISAGNSYTTSFSVPIAGIWRISGRIGSNYYTQQRDVQVGDNLVFTSPVSGTLSTVSFYLYDRNSATPANIQPPQDIYYSVFTETPTPPEAGYDYNDANNYLTSYEPTTVYWNKSFIAMGNLTVSSLSYKYREALKLNITGLDSVNISKVELSLYHYYNTVERTQSSTVEVYNLSAKWYRNYTSWTNYKDGVAWTNPGGDWKDSASTSQGTIPYDSYLIPSGSPLYSNILLNVTDLYTQSVALGRENISMIIKLNNTNENETDNYIAFYSLNNPDTNLRPHLDITYTTSTPDPLIISWGNNKTNDQTLNITVTRNIPIKFNATSNQTVTWTWLNNYVDAGNNYDNITLNWSIASNYTVKVYGSNTNGTSNTITWNVQVTPPLIPGTPTMTITNSSYDWINASWVPGAGNITDYYYLEYFIDRPWNNNISRRSSYTNSTFLNFSGTNYQGNTINYVIKAYNFTGGESNPEYDSIIVPAYIHVPTQSDVFYNTTNLAHGNYTIYARSYNSTYGSYSDWAESTVTVPNNAPVQFPIGNKNVTDGQWLNFTVNATDADSDTITYGTNATNGTLNTTTGNFNWSTTSEDVGTYYWNFNSSDGYGAEDSETITVTVNAEATEAPAITSYSPADLTPTIDVNALTTFNAGTSQNVQWTWTGATEGAGDGTTNSTATQTWTTTGDKTVTVTCSNSNGSCGTIQWDVTVVSDGSGGGTNWDYLTGTVTPVGSTITINPSVTGSPATGGAYTFGYVFVDGQTYWVNVTKTGYTANNTQITFNEDHEVWDVNLVISTTTWWNSKTNDDNLIVHVNGTDSVEFRLELSTITTAVWTLDNSIQSETSANFTTSLNTLGVHSLSAYGNIPTGVTQTVTWKLLSKRVKSDAGDETTLLNGTWFDDLTNSMNGNSPDFTQFVGALIAPYTTQMGAVFYVFIYVLPLVIIWLRQEKVLIPSGLLGIFGLALLPMLPEEWRLLAGLCVILTSFGIVYSLFKERG